MGGAGDGSSVLILMKYIVNEIFQSIKGEGVHLGRPMNFVRMARCNLTCDHCDTQFNVPATTMSVADILSRLHSNLRCVVLTGGEPTAQRLEPLIRALYNDGFKVHIESNGTLPFPDVSITWVCISPKLQFGEPLEDNMTLANEVKMPVSAAEDIDRAEAFRLKYNKLPTVWYLHPWNSNFTQVQHGTHLGDGSRNMLGYNEEANKLCVEYAIKTGTWNVSIQAHKVLAIK